jgi:hypothetical protein
MMLGSMDAWVFILYDFLQACQFFLPKQLSLVQGQIKFKTGSRPVI